jgi:hypothetical protein
LNIVSLSRPHNQSVNPKGHRIRVTVRGSMNYPDSTHSLLALSEIAASSFSCSVRAW